MRAPGRPRGLYLITQRGLVPGSGARRHIEAGLAELSRHFEMARLELGPPAPPKAAPEPGAFEQPAALAARPKASIALLKPFTRTAAAGAARDARTWFRHRRDGAAITAAAKAHSADFIYERAAYLSFAGLGAARALGIPHIYEVNGLQHLEVRKYYPSLANSLAKVMEKSAYRASDHVFFVGSWGDAMQLPTSNWENIENGVEESFLGRFGRPREAPDGVIRVCFVGHVMPHHRLDVIRDAFRQVRDPARIEFHLIGTCPEAALAEIQSLVPVVAHGVLDRVALAEVLADMHVGLVTGDKEFASYMKLLDYGAARLLTIAPDLHNFRRWFAPDGLFLVDRCDAASIAGALNGVCANPALVPRHGNRLHREIREKFTWERIFGHVAEVIRRGLRTSP